MDDNRTYDDYSINFSVTEKDRILVRKIVIGKFLEENGGYWKGDIKHVTRYKYFVEILQDGRKLFLLRPTFLNKGIDFQVWVEKFDGQKDKKPSHKDVFLDLDRKKAENPANYSNLQQLINQVWNGEEPDDVIHSSNISFTSGWTVEMLLKILKWLFIEQDITYWNYDGRGMLKQAIDKH